MEPKKSILNNSDIFLFDLKSVEQKFRPNKRNW